MMSEISYKIHPAKTFGMTLYMSLLGSLYLLAHYAHYFIMCRILQLYKPYVYIMACVSHVHTLVATFIFGGIEKKKGLEWFSVPHTKISSIIL